jgi:hypothetical protein
MLKYLTIFDMNLYELPAFKNYDGFILELFSVIDDTQIKETSKIFKFFSKTSVSWIFADFGFFNLRNYHKRCRLDRCNIWNNDYLWKPMD